MKKILFLTVILGVVLMIFTVIGFSVNSQERNMQELNLQTKIGDGKDKEVTPLFDGERRKIVQITLRNKAVLDAHKAAEPITIQCIAGEGKLIVGQEKEEVDLQKGVLVTIEPNVVHEIRATPKVSILLTKFKDKWRSKRHAESCYKFWNMTEIIFPPVNIRDNYAGVYIWRMN